jgi:ABC-type transport system involved in multi-copper enzyme maturation permease subunit
MRAYLHDFRHILTSRILLVVVVLTILGVALAYSAIKAQTASVTIDGSGFYYYEGGAYHIQLWAFDVAGEPVEGVLVELSYALGSNANGSQNWAYAGGTSSADGYLPLLLSVPDEGASPLIAVKYGGAPGSALQLGGALQGFGLVSLSAGEVGGLDPLIPVAENLYSTVGKLLVTWAGPNGSAPTGSQLAYCSTTYQEGQPPPRNCSGLPVYPIGYLTDIRTVFASPIGPPATSITVELLDPRGAVVDTYGFVPGVVHGAPVQPQPAISIPSPPGDQALVEFVFEAPLLLILLSLVVAYTIYAQPRLSGVLEPVLVRPVTHRGILLERYLATAALLSAATVADVLIFDLTAWKMLGQPVPPTYLAPLVASLVAASLSMAGLIFLLSHLFRTAGGVLTLGLTLVLILGLFWGELSTFALSALGGTPTDYELLVSQLRLESFSPANLPLLTVGYLDGLGTTGGSGGRYALGGISPGLLAVIAGLWVAAPLLGAARLAARRD